MGPSGRYRGEVVTKQSAQPAAKYVRHSQRGSGYLCHCPAALLAHTLYGSDRHSEADQPLQYNDDVLQR
jgi:hypothetical protein